MTVVKKTAEIGEGGYNTLSDANLIQQLDWVQANVDGNAVGVSGVTASFDPDQPTVCEVEYFADEPADTNKE